MTRAPLLLAAPSRWADASRRAALAALVGLALLVVAAIGLAGEPSIGDADRAGFALDTGLVEGVRHGGAYYDVAADLVRGSEATARPVVGVRLPTLAVIAAALPRRVVPILLVTLALAAVLAWYERLSPAFARRGAGIGAAVLLLAGVAAAFRPEGALIPEDWAGLFVALSLARWRPDRPVEAIGWMLAAALVDDAAALAMGAMAIAAIVRRDRPELVGWIVALAVLALVILAHRHAVAVAGIVFADPIPVTVSGIGGLLAGLAAATALAPLSSALGATLLVAALAGWSVWRDPLASRVLAVIAVLLVAAASSPVGGGIAALVAPLSLAGLVFLPDGLRDLARAALDRRRIVVRRVAR